MGRVHAKVFGVTGPNIESPLKASTKSTPSPETLPTSNVFSPLKHNAQLKDNPNPKPTKKWKKRARGGGTIAIPNFLKFSPIPGQKRSRDPVEQIGTGNMKHRIELEDAAEEEK